MMTWPAGDKLVHRPVRRWRHVSSVGLAFLLAGVVVAPTESGAQSNAAILRNALLIRFVPPSAVAVGGESAISPFLQSTLDYYQGLSSTNAAALSNFSPSSSAAARRDVVSGKLDVGISSAPLNAVSTDVPDAQVAQYVQIPVAATAVALSYNLSFPTSVTITSTVGGQQLSATTSDTCSALLAKYPLVVTPSTLSGIFSGQISQWSASAIQASNPQLNFRALVPIAASYTSHGTTHPQRNQKQVVNCLRFVSTPNISLVGPTSGSGLNVTMTDYLSQVDPTDFPATTDATPALVATPLNDNAAIASAISSTDGALGYLPWSNVQSAGLATARLQVSSKGVTSNQSLTASTVRKDLTAAVTTIAANGGFSVLQGTSRYDVTNAGAGYPLVGLIFAMTPRSPGSTNLGVTVAKYLAWLSQNAPSGIGSSFGQSFASGTAAIALPMVMRQYDFSQLLTMSVNGVSSLNATN